MTTNITELLGIDDWLIFGRREDGVIVYTVTECWGDWLDAPHKGDAAFRSPEDIEDWLYIAGVCARLAPDLWWEEAATVDTDGTALTVDVERLWLHDRMPAMTVDTSDCGSGQCDPNTGCPACNDDDRTWTRAR